MNDEFRKYFHALWSDVDEDGVDLSTADLASSSVRKPLEQDVLDCFARASEQSRSFPGQLFTPSFYRKLASFFARRDLEVLLAAISGDSASLDEIIGEYKFELLMVLCFPRV